MEYFKHPERMGETRNLQDCLNIVFKQLYDKNYLERNQNKKIKQYGSQSDHPFINILLKHFGSPNPIKMDPDKSKCDLVLAEYLHKVSKLVRAEYLIKILKFVFLYRECLNIIYSEKAAVIDKNKEYTQLFTAEDSPDICNEFVVEFIEGKSKLFQINEEEANDLTNNFCQWLYDNNYTSYKVYFKN